MTVQTKANILWAIPEISRSLDRIALIPPLGEMCMTSLTIRNMDDAIKQRLRMRAAHHGVSMEEEARRILKEALRPAEAPSGLGKRLQDRFAGVAAEEFVVPKRHTPHGM